MVAYSWENTEKKGEEKKKKREKSAGLLSGPCTPAVKTSNHMRKSKRFLRVPLLHLLNFYNLVGCQALGSINTFHAIATPWSRKTERRDSEQDCCLNHSAVFLWPLSAFRKDDGIVCLCAFRLHIDAFIMQPQDPHSQSSFLSRSETCL